MKKSITILAYIKSRIILLIADENKIKERIYIGRIITAQTNNKCYIMIKEHNIPGTSIFAIIIPK